METCSMCRKKAASLDAILPNGKPICPECAQKMDDFLESDDHAVVKDALNYIYACAKDAQDPEVGAFLKSMLWENDAALEEIEREAKDAERSKKREKPVDFSKAPDYFADRKAAQEGDGLAEAPAISRIFSGFAWFQWIGGAIAAIIVGVTMPSNGFVWFVGLASAAFVSGCMPMALAYILKYLAQIARNTSGQQNKAKQS